jgi:NAD(P)H-dependent FMN reductase
MEAVSLGNEYLELSFALCLALTRLARHIGIVMRILAISGSLRKQSYNTAALRLAQSIAPQGVAIEIFERISEFPLFNPDLGDGNEYAAVVELREKIRSADAVLVACPEYVHGVPGAFKNALDWIVGTGELDGKPVGLINATPALGGAQWVRDALLEILNVMSANHVVPDAVLRLDGIRKRMNEQGVILDQETGILIQKCLEALIRAASRNKA